MKKSTMRITTLIATLTVVILTIGFALITVNADGGVLEELKACKAENAECTINESGHDCCTGLVCVPFNGVSGNGKCAKIVTPTPTVTSTPTPKVACEEVVVIGDCTYELVDAD